MKTTINKLSILLALLSASTMLHAATMCRYCGSTVFGNCSKSPSGQHEHIVVSSLEALTPKIQQSKAGVEVGDEAIGYARGRNIDPAGLMRSNTGVDQYGIPTDPIKRAQLRERLNMEYASKHHGNHAASDSVTAKQPSSLCMGTKGTELTTFLGVAFGEDVRQRKFKSFNDSLLEAGKTPSDVCDYDTKKDLFTFKLNPPYRIYHDGMVKATATGKIYFIGMVQQIDNNGRVNAFDELAAIRTDLVRTISGFSGVSTVTELSKEICRNTKPEVWETFTKAWNGSTDGVLECHYFVFYDQTGNPSQIISLGLVRYDSTGLYLRFCAEDVALENQAEAKASCAINRNPPVQPNYSSDPYMAEKMRVKLNEEYEDECRQKGKRR